MPAKDGLRLGYAYTVLGTVDVGLGKRLICIRGPLPPEKGWNGDWAEESPLWTPEALSRLPSVTGANELGNRRCVRVGRESFWNRHFGPVVGPMVG